MLRALRRHDAIGGAVEHDRRTAIVGCASSQLDRYQRWMPGALP
jgi:hypothetical protein